MLDSKSEIVKDTYRLVQEGGASLGLAPAKPVKKIFGVTPS